MPSWKLDKLIYILPGNTAQLRKDKEILHFHQYNPSLTILFCSGLRTNPALLAGWLNNYPDGKAEGSCTHVPSFRILQPCLQLLAGRWQPGRWAVPLCPSKGSRAGPGMAPGCSQHASRQVLSGKQVWGQAGRSIWQAGITRRSAQAQPTCCIAQARWRGGSQLFTQQAELRLCSCSTPILAISPKAPAKGQRLRSCSALRALASKLPLLWAAESSEYSKQNA